MADEGRILGIDFGLKRVGISVSDPLGILARGLETLPNDHGILSKIVDIVRRMSVRTIVIGKPLRLNGSESSSSLEALKFGERLKAKLSTECTGKIDIVDWDERFTTTMAQRTQIELGVKKKERQKKGNLDRMASQIILQSYLDSRTANRVSDGHDNDEREK